MTRIYPIVCFPHSAPMDDAASYERPNTTSDRTEGWMQTRHPAFSYDGTPVWICPECVDRLVARCARTKWEIAQDVDIHAIPPLLFMYIVRDEWDREERIELDHFYTGDALDLWIGYGPQSKTLVWWQERR